MEGGLGGSLGRHLLPEPPPHVADGGSCELELPWKLDLPVTVDGPLAGVLEGYGGGGGEVGQEERRGGGARGEEGRRGERRGDGGHSSDVLASASIRPILEVFRSCF